MLCPKSDPEKFQNNNGGKYCPSRERLNTCHNWLWFVLAISQNLNEPDSATTGNIGTSILTGVLRSYTAAVSSGQKPVISKFILTVSSDSSAEKLRTRFSDHEAHLQVRSSGNAEAMKSSDIVILAIKPYMVNSVLRQPGVKDALKGRLVISVLVGTPLARLYYGLTGKVDEEYMMQPFEQREYHIVRAMMNMAAAFGESMTVIEKNSLAAGYETLVDWIFVQVGKIAHVTPDLYDVGGVMVGTTSPFLTVALDGLLDGAVNQGLKRLDARRMLAQNLRGLAALLENDEHPAMIREKAASPRGTTIAGLLSLEEDRVRAAFSKAVIKSTERSIQIGK